MTTTESSLQNDQQQTCQQQQESGKHSPEVISASVFQFGGNSKFFF